MTQVKLVARIAQTSRLAIDVTLEELAGDLNTNRFHQPDSDSRQGFLLPGLNLSSSNRCFKAYRHLLPGGTNNLALNRLEAEWILGVNTGWFHYRQPWKFAVQIIFLLGRQRQSIFLLDFLCQGRPVWAASGSFKLVDNFNVNLGKLKKIST